MSHSLNINPILTKTLLLNFSPCHNTATGIKTFAEASNDDTIDFVESLQYSPSTSVVMRGYLTNEAPANKINKINAWYNPWFYKHVQSFLGKSKGLEGAKYEEVRFSELWRVFGEVWD